MWEKKSSSFEIHVIILSYIRNVNLPFKKDFKFAELLTKTSFFLYFRNRPKNGEGNKLRRRRKYMSKSNKHASKKVAKAEANLNWLWTIELIMDCFDCTFISTNDLASLFDTNTNVLTVFMMPLLHHLLCSKSTKSMKANRNISTEWAKVLSFVWEKVLCYRKVIYFLIKTSLETFFKL